MQDPDAAARELLQLLRGRRESGGCASTSVLGGSLGGGIAARASALSEPGEIERLVLLAPSSSTHPERIQSLPLVALAAYDYSGDDRRPRWPSILREFEAMPSPKRLWVLPGEAHAQALFDTEVGAALIEEIADFLLAGGEEPEADLTEP